MMTQVKTAAEIEAMRVSGKMLAAVLQHLKNQVQAGMSTKDLAIIAARELERLGGKPAFLGYQGFPDVICISVNEEVVHGIPSAGKILQAGDILGLDFGVVYNGMITDGAISVIVGKPKEQRHLELVRATETSMYEGIAAVRDHVRTGDIGAAVQTVLDKGKFGIVRDLVGHGVGHQLHEDPNVPNYGRPHTGPWLSKGMTIAIEPMATLGTDKVYVAPDQWTILTADKSMAAHFEHTVLITEDGAEILTEV
ncbi:MAG: Methionine aminopeptidase [Candidatus Saccharibacteria bacterium]|nr:Methionine aminopeptidase [Candidatus Saccharibacteria bacterium]